MKNLKILFTLVVSIFYGLSSTIAQVTSPKEHFGFQIGDDYQLANFTQTESYLKKIASQSPRIKYTVIGKTEEGREQPMLIITSDENQKQLSKYQEIAQKLARAELSEAEAQQLSKEGKAIVWIDGGLHSNETVGMHQLIEMAYRLASAQDEETLEILDHTIILLTHANPDGQELISNWYMREKDPLKRSLANVPVLYQKYAGHDNNRDFFMLNLKESQNIAKQLFIQWNPQIMYNHHQTAPAGAVVAGAPYRDPFNYVFDPLLMTGIESLGAAMSSRLNSENKPGYTQRGGSVFSTWYNGGLRTTTYFHNTIGLLTEIIGGPTPFEIPLVTSRLLPSSDTHNPVLPQKWHFKQSIDYSVSLNYAVLNYASKYRKELLFNIFRMGKNSIEKGSKDHWSLSPSKIAVIDSAYNNAKKIDKQLANTRYIPTRFMDSLITNPKYRDPRGYILPANDENIATTIKFLNALSANGIKIMQATQNFTVNNKSYPANSYIIKTDQAFRPHILDMFEPQDHPNDFEYPGGPPIPPYDAAGWTLAYLMHINFDRILSDFSGPFVALDYGQPISIPKKPLLSSSYIGLSAKDNSSFSIINQLLKAKQKVFKDTLQSTFWIKSNKEALAIINNANIPTTGTSQLPASLKELKSLRIGLWDAYGGNMASGWLRLILEQHHFDFNVFYSPEIDKGNLSKHYDVIILVGGATPNTRVADQQRSTNDLIPEGIPEPYKQRWGRMSIEKSIPQLEKFIRDGGQIIATGNSSNIADHLKLAVSNALVDDNNEPLKREKFYSPGSVLTARLNLNTTSTSGYPNNIDLYFDNNRAYKILDKSITPIAWFDSDKVLKSGWSWGEKYLKNGVIAFEAKMDKGKLIVFTPDITFRAQTHGTFKLLFNNLYK